LGEQKMVSLTIDGKTATVPEGTNILEAAKSVGIRVPNFCYHPDLPWEGSCRMCLVQVGDWPKLTTSCTETARDGMEVSFADKKASDARDAQLEFLLVNHPLDCPICDQAGECKLQDYYVEDGRHFSRMPRALKVHKKKVVDLGERIVLDKERCVTCSRCVRFTRHISGSHALQFFTRGVNTEIGTENDAPIVGDDYIGNVVDICPVGALTSKDFRFKQRVWFLRSAESVCAGCSTGCNIRVDHKGGKIYRFVPRRNPEVNKSWICDYGRDSYKTLQSEKRLFEPRARRAGELTSCTWEEALGAVGSILDNVKGQDRPAVAAIASPRASTETLFVFKGFAAEVLGTEMVDYRIDGSHGRTEERSDKLLRRADPHPNNTGCRLLGLDQAASVNAILDACDKGEIKLLYLLGPELLTNHPDPERIRSALSRVEYMVMHSAYEVENLGLASVVLPDLPHIEIDGTFVNFEGRVQRFDRAYPPTMRARPAAQVLAELAWDRRVALPRGTAAEIFNEMSSAEAAFGGLTFDQIERFGTVIAAAEPATAS
jgi:NADH-quinone oxidoreductase subunit G